MSINFRINNSIKRATDIFVGVNGQKHRIVKVLTGIQGQKRIIYEYKQAGLRGYYFVGQDKKLYNSLNLIDFDEILDCSASRYASICYANGKLYCFEYTYYGDIGQSLPSFLTIINEDKTIETHNIPFYDTYKTYFASGESSSGRLTDIVFIGGKFVATGSKTARIGTTTRYNQYAYLYYSSDGYNWSSAQIMSRTTTSSYASTYNLRVLGSLKKGTDNSQHLLIFRNTYTSSGYTYGLTDYNLDNNTAVSSSLTVTAVDEAVFVNISDTIITRGSRRFYYNNSGALTSETVSEATYPKVKRGNVFFGYYNTNLYRNNTSIISGGTFRAITDDGNGVLAYDSTNKAYKVSDTGTVTDLGVQTLYPLVPETINSSYRQRGLKFDYVAYIPQG